MPHILVLNDMREHVMSSTVVAVADDPDKLDAFVKAEQVEVWIDDLWMKSFRKGGPLEWFQPPTYNSDGSIIASEMDALGRGVTFVQGEDEYVESARAQYRQAIGTAIRI